MQFFTNYYRSLTQKYGKNTVIIGIIVLLILIVITLKVVFRDGADATVTEGGSSTAVTRTVSLYTISASNGTAVRTADGKAYVVRAESGGRVDRIASVGDTVLRGTVVAQLENSAERALVLQAQGAYEAAKAGASVSNVGSESADRAYTEAVTQAENTYRSAFSTTDNILRNTVDQIFSQPESGNPGLKIDGQGRATEYGRERAELEKLFNEWRTSVNTKRSDNITGMLKDAESDTSRLSTFVVTLTSLLSDNDAIEDSVRLETLRTDFAGARTALTQVLASLSGARSSLIQAESAKEQASIAGTQGDVSLADAQVKQALGVLESARAALNKTSVKTPVAGTVTGVSISVGDIINVGSDVVFVASDATVETENTVTVPLTAVKFTPSKAFIFTVEEGKLVAHEVETGAVTTKSITISGADGVDTIVLDVRGLKDGDAVVVQ